MKTRAVSLAILMLGATGVATADQDDHHGWDHDRGRGWSDKHGSPTQAPEIDPASTVAAPSVTNSRESGLVMRDALASDA